MVLKNIFSAKFLFLAIFAYLTIWTILNYPNSFSEADSILLKAEIVAEYQAGDDDLEQIIVEKIKSLQLQNWKDQINRVEKNQKEIQAGLVKVIIILERLDKKR
jgi:hypothetical protein